MAAAVNSNRPRRVTRGLKFLKPMCCPINNDISAAAAILREGGLVAFPTETVYGLGANALNPHAVARIFAVKNRPRLDPLIVHAHCQAALAPLLQRFPPIAQQLAEQFWPGPLTLVLPKADMVPDLVTSGLPSVAVRVPDHPLALELLRTVELPLAAPSANPFGRISPTTARHVADQLGDQIDLILDGGPCKVGVESTVLSLLDERPRMLRPGGVSLEDLQQAIGPIETINSSAPTSQPQASPGMLAQHYAPRIPVIIEERPDPANHAEERIGLLAFAPVPDARQFTAVEVLSEQGSLEEAAVHFFAALRRLDELGLEVILATPFPEAGLGRALNDRLRRAAAR